MDPTIVKFINCMSAAALKDKFSSAMPTAPNIPVLHNALHSAIKTDKLEGAKYIAIAIKLLAKKEERENVWRTIVTGDALKNASNKPFTWERYFAEDITRRKKKNEKERNESILHLYKSGTISMFRAIEHPKIFFALLKLGADPFQRNSKGETLSLAVVESRTLVKSSRLQLLQQMLKKKILTVEPSGPDLKSPIDVCVVNQKDSLKYLVQVPGIENLKIKDRNVLVVLGTYAESLMQYFSVPQLVKLLSERYEGKLVATRLQILKMPDHWNYVMAIKELIKDDPNLLPELKNNGIPEKVLINFINDGKNTTPEEDRLANQMRKMQLEQFWGNTEFNLAALPAELLEMVTANLGSQDQVCLWSVSKELKSMMNDYHWQQMVKVDSPMLCRQLEVEKKNWLEKAAPRIRSSYRWKRGQYVLKKLRTPPSPVQLNPRNIDEYWFASTQGKKLHLWNLSNGSAKIFKLGDEAQKVEFMSTDAYEVPPLIFSQFQHFGFRINNKVTEIKYADVGVQEGDRLLFNLSDNRILISSNTCYDINLQRTFKINDKYRLGCATFNPFNNMFVGLTNTENITIMDKDLNTVSQAKWTPNFQSYSPRHCKVHILDEYTVIASADTSHIFDLRTMKVIKILPRVMYNGAGRGIERFVNNAPFGLVWNFKTMESESCVVYPNRGRTQYTDFVCNSKLAIFSTGIPYSLTSLMF